MAKKMAKTLAKAQRPRARAQTGAEYALNQRLRSHIGMLLDPCTSVLGPTAYRGKDGILTRFKSTLGYAGQGTDSHLVIAYHPSINRVYFGTIATQNTNFAMDFYGAQSYPGPGGAFLGTNAAEVRPVGACIVSNFTGTELERQGLCTRGIVPAQATTGTLTINAILPLLQRADRVPDQQVETKWLPCPVNEDYTVIPTAAVPRLVDNIIVVIYHGLAASALKVSVNVHSIMEWQPYYNLGLVAPTPSTPDPPAGLERVRTALANMGDWWLEATKTARAGAQFYNTIRAGARLARPAVALLAAP